MYVRVPADWKWLGELTGNGFLSVGVLGEALLDGLVRADISGTEYVGYMTEVVDDDFEGCS